MQGKLAGETVPLFFRFSAVQRNGKEKEKRRFRSPFIDKSDFVLHQMAFSFRFRFSVFPSLRSQFSFAFGFACFHTRTLYAFYSEPVPL